MSERQYGWHVLPAFPICRLDILRVSLLLAFGFLAAACGGGGGGGGGTAQAASSGGAPSLSLSASSTSLAVGGSVTLTWQSSGADSCRASGGWGGDKPLSGSETVGPLQTSQNFALSCSGTGGGALREVFVNVGGGPLEVNLSSSDNLVMVNDQVELTWTSTSADTCEASGAWSGTRPVSGSFTTPPLTDTSTFKLTCFAQGESAVALVTVEVSDTTVRWQAPTENVDGSPLTDLAGFNVYWGVSSRDYGSSVSLGPDARAWDVNLGSGTYYLAITAVDSETNESGYSAEIVKVIP